MSLTEGCGVVEIDLTDFTLSENLDYYAAITFLAEPPPPGNTKPKTSALEISVRGTKKSLCSTPNCNAFDLGIVARWSENIGFDAVNPEPVHVGEGINYRQRLPIGLSLIFKVKIEFGLGFVRISSFKTSWTASRGASNPRFGWFNFGVGRPPGGIGWAREPWTLQNEKHKGKAKLFYWGRTCNE